MRPVRPRRFLTLAVSIAMGGLVACSTSTNAPPVTTSGSGGASAGSGGATQPGSGGTIQPGSGGEQGSGGAPGSGGVPAPVDASSTDGKPSDAPAGADTGGQPGNGGDQTPDRPLNIDTTAPKLYTTNFLPTAADPTSTGQNQTQTALVDTSKTMQKKLVIVLAGSNGTPGPAEVNSFAANLGFHSFAIAYHNEYDVSTITPPNADLFGNSRFNELDGGTRKPSAITVPRSESVEERMLKALAYLQTKNPQGDWGYYLQKDGTIRWSDVVFIGHSHGATSAAAFAKVHRVWRAISLSGPRDTNPVVATWLTMPTATPIDRYYGFTGTADPQHPDHIKSMEIMGYVGKLTPIEGATPPYGGSHRLQYNGAHGDSANCGTFAATCRYFFGVQ